jgi:hypothetical protein
MRKKRMLHRATAFKRTTKHQLLLWWTLSTVELLRGVVYSTFWCLSNHKMLLKKMSMLYNFSERNGLASR